MAKQAAIEGGNQAAGNIPVVGGLIGAGQGLKTAATGALETEASRGAEKQRAIDSLLDDSALADQARERLEAARQRKPGAELEPAQQRRITKGLQRYDQALAAAEKWQRGKGAKGVMPLMSRQASDQLDE